VRWTGGIHQKRPVKSVKTANHPGFGNQWLQKIAFEVVSALKNLPQKDMSYLHH
jgi:hypothetical protein